MSPEFAENLPNDISTDIKTIDKQTRKHNVSETGSVSVLRWRGPTL
jgi:hypothetical protein